jgi:hypothetical protein
MRSPPVSLCGVTKGGPHVARRKALYEELHPETKRGGDRKRGKGSSGKTCHLKEPPAPRFTADAAKASGQSERTVRQELPAPPPSRPSPR